MSSRRASSSRRAPNGSYITFANSSNGLNSPLGLAFDQFGTLYLLNRTNTLTPEILRFDTTTANQVTFAGSAGLDIPAFIVEAYRLGPP